MNINSINTSGNFIISVSSAYAGNKALNQIASTSSNNAKDTAIISNSAKELAAQISGKSSQEEATESGSERLAEQTSGKD